MSEPVSNFFYNRVRQFVNVGYEDPEYSSRVPGHLLNPLENYSLKNLFDSVFYGDNGYDAKYGTPVPGNLKYTWECPANDGTRSLLLSTNLNDLSAGELHCHLMPDPFDPMGAPTYECRAGFIDPVKETHLLYRRAVIDQKCHELLEEGPNISVGSCEGKDNLFYVYLEKTGRQRPQPGARKKPRKVRTIVPAPTPRKDTKAKPETVSEESARETVEQLPTVEPVSSGETEAGGQLKRETSASAEQKETKTKPETISEGSIRETAEQLPTVEPVSSGETEAGGQPKRETSAPIEQKETKAKPETVSEGSVRETPEQLPTVELVSSGETEAGGQPKRETSAPIEQKETKAKPETVSEGSVRETAEQLPTVEPASENQQSAPPPPTTTTTASEIHGSGSDASGFVVSGGFGLMLYTCYKLVQAARKYFAVKREEEAIQVRRNHQGSQGCAVWRRE